MTPPDDGAPATEWAAELGLAISPLFGVSGSGDAAAHYALLDGRRGSFAWSPVPPESISNAESQSWRWSADLPHHICVTATEVSVRSGRDAARRFGRASVEHRLGEFCRFLETPQARVLPDVVPFLTEEFRQVWATLPGEEVRGQVALAAFLVALGAAGEPDASVFEDRAWRQRQAQALGLDAAAINLISELPSLTVQRAVGIAGRAPLQLRLDPSLVFRHSAGRLFQEAHAYLEEVQLGLFGESAVSTVPTFSPSGAFFTPVPIARLLAECALRELVPLPESLAIADYACGSGVFLTEALRALDRQGFSGSITLIGRDISDEALVMARAGIATIVRDLPHMRVSTDLSNANALETPHWARADVVLMNPPFRSWERMSDSEREWVRAALASGPKVGRPDLSAGFVSRALEALRPRGVLATLVPAGVLASDGLAEWRNGLLERACPRLVGVLGDHGLFRSAVVNVGLLVLSDTPSGGQSFAQAWASPEDGAASGAMRAIRRMGREAPPIADSRASINEQGRWTVSRQSVETLRQRPSWLPGSNALGPLLERIMAAVPDRVEDLFDVHQGIRTGAKEIFLRSAEYVRGLPKREQQWFVPAVTTESFHSGVIEAKSYLFVAGAWTSEAEVAERVPRFFDEVLAPARPQLMTRGGIRTEQWWRLTRVRKWTRDGRPRLVSKRFGLLPAFALDLAAAFAAVQANAWIPKSALTSTLAPEQVADFLTAYWWLLNSNVAVSLFQEYCPNVAGGQLDLEHKYVRHVPMPNLVERMQADSTLQAIARDIRQSSSGELPSLVLRDRFAAAAFGSDISEWIRKRHRSVGGE